jgi:LPXTG-site transpeptidase (sortase) family protein
MKAVPNDQTETGRTDVTVQGDGTTAAGKAARAARLARLVLLCCLAMAISASAAWYGSQWLEGRATTRRLESAWNSRISAAASPDVKPGDVIGRIVIPAMGLDSTLVEMAGVDDMENLDRGPAHISGTALPGANGNCVVAGHRTTHGRPFFHLDTLKAGDSIVLINGAGRAHNYSVTGSQVVSPDDVAVMDPTPGPAVTLIACHPPFSARHRLVVSGTMYQTTAR